jgi:hypothetical protein
MILARTPGNSLERNSMKQRSKCFGLGLAHFLRVVDSVTSQIEYHLDLLTCGGLPPPQATVFWGLDGSDAVDSSELPMALPPLSSAG